jgi:hypothetical protein
MQLRSWEREISERSIEQGFPPPWSETWKLKWPGLEVEATERDLSGMDGPAWVYTFTQNGNEIFKTEEMDYRTRTRKASFKGRPYFYIGPYLAIHHPMKSRPDVTQGWFIWTASDDSVISWMTQYMSRRQRLRKKRQEREFFEDPHYGIRKFEQKGRTWTITLRDMNWEMNRYNDWMGGMPEVLHVDSHDDGRKWKVRERVSIPEWLIEVGKRSK